MAPRAGAYGVVVPRILVLQRRRPRRDRWSDALVTAGFEVVARDTVRAACAALWQQDFDAILAETPPEQELADLLDAAPGPWPPPILLIGAPYGEPVAVPRAFAAALYLGDPPAAELPELVRELLATVGLARPAVPHGRTDVPLRMPPARVAKWKSWLITA